ncbi:hypothetical protein V1514DRAFT_333661 [Lipomyces japonicus]|uniref:uncharacterized protein n=1 Tax=Lipomyces japonicus TaxID=56871 RepID=UPI0034CD9AC1
MALSWSASLWNWFADTHPFAPGSFLSLVFTVPGVVFKTFSSLLSISLVFSNAPSKSSNSEFHQEIDNNDGDGNVINNKNKNDDDADADDRDDSGLFPPIAPVDARLNHVTNTSGLQTATPCATDLSDTTLLHIHNAGGQLVGFDFSDQSLVSVNTGTTTTTTSNTTATDSYSREQSQDYLLQAMTSASAAHDGQEHKFLSFDQHAQLLAGPLIKPPLDITGSNQAEFLEDLGTYISDINNKLPYTTLAGDGVNNGATAGSAFRVARRRTERSGPGQSPYARPTSSYQAQQHQYNPEQYLSMSDVPSRSPSLSWSSPDVVVDDGASLGTAADDIAFNSLLEPFDAAATMAAGFDSISAMLQVNDEPLLASYVSSLPGPQFFVDGSANNVSGLAQQSPVPRLFVQSVTAPLSDTSSSPQSWQASPLSFAASPPSVNSSPASFASPLPPSPSPVSLHSFLHLPPQHNQEPIADLSVTTGNSDVTGPLTFQCPHCPSRFRIKGYLTRHLKKHAVNKAYKCPFFDSASSAPCHSTGGFSRRDTYKTHLKSRHFVYPAGTRSDQRAGMRGWCALCGMLFENNEDWVEKHVECRECRGLQALGSTTPAVADVTSVSDVPVSVVDPAAAFDVSIGSAPDSMYA